MFIGEMSCALVFIWKKWRARRKLASASLNSDSVLIPLVQSGGGAADAQPETKPLAFRDSLICILPTLFDLVGTTLYVHLQCSLLACAAVSGSADSLGWCRLQPCDMRACACYDTHFDVDPALGCCTQQALRTS